MTNNASVAHDQQACVFPCFHRPRAAAGCAFVAWSVGLLLVGVRAVHGWTWARAAAALGLVAAVMLVAGLLPAVT